MPIRSIADIRTSWGRDWANASDEEVLGAYSKATNIDPARLANDFGYAPSSSLTGQRLGGAVDSYQSNLYGAAGAVARGMGLSSGFLDRRRDDNKLQADIAASRAKQLGGVDDWRDVSGVGSGLNYLGGLVAQSLPYAGEAIVGGLTGGVGFAGTAARMGLTGAAARTTARVAGATVAGYPSAVGDILSNQRDQNGGENLGWAAAGGVPYSLLNAGLGVEGRLARGALARNSIRALDDLGSTGGYAARAGGYAARTAATVGRVGLGEGLSETGQEFINQRFGRMAVDDNETLFNPEANKRYVDSFVGGAALGGAFGAVGGGRRSQGYQPPSIAPSIESGGQGNLLGGADNNNLIAGDYSQLPLGAPTAFEDGSFNEMMNQKAQLQNAMRYAEQVGDQTGFTRARAALSELAPKLASLEDAFNRTRVADAGQRSLFGEGPSLEEGPNQPRNPALPQPIVDAAGAVVTDRNTAQALSDPYAIRDRDAYLASLQEQASKAEGQKQAAQFGNKMKSKGLNPADKDQSSFFRQLDAAVAQGAISADRADELIGQVLSPTPIAPQAIVTSIIRPAVKAAADTKKATEQDANKRKVVADSAVLESRAGGISLDGLDSVLEALNTSQAAGQTALRLARAAEIAVKKQAGKDAAQAVKDAADAAKLKAAQAAMPPKAATQPTKPANVINAEAPKVDPSPAPVVQAAAVQPAASPVVGETAAVQPTGTVDAGVSDAGPGAIKKPRVFARAAAPAAVVKEDDTPQFGTPEFAEYLQRELDALGDAPAGGTKVKSGQGGGQIIGKAMAIYIKMAMNHIAIKGKQFAAYLRMIREAKADISAEDARFIYAEANKQLKNIRTDLVLDPKGNSTFTESKNGEGVITKRVYKVKGQDRSVVVEVRPEGLMATATISRNGEKSFYPTEFTVDGKPMPGGKTGSSFKLATTPIDKPVLLGDNWDAAEQMLPFVAHEAGLTSKLAATKKTTVAVGAGLDRTGKADFGKVNDVLRARPVWNLAVRLYMGVDEFGYRTGEDLTQESAIRLASEQLGDESLLNSQAQLSDMLNDSLGFTKAVRKAFQAAGPVEPMPGYGIEEDVDTEDDADNDTKQKRVTKSDSFGEVDEQADEQDEEVDGDQTYEKPKKTIKAEKPTLEDDANTDESLDSEDDEKNARAEYIADGFQTSASTTRPIINGNAAATPLVAKVLDKEGNVRQDTTTLDVAMAHSASLRFSMLKDMNGKESALVRGYAENNSRLIEDLTSLLWSRPRGDIIQAARAVAEMEKNDGNMQKVKAGKQSDKSQKEATDEIKNAPAQIDTILKKSVTTRRVLDSIDKSGTPDTKYEGGGDERDSAEDYDGRSGEADSEVSYSKVGSNEGLTRRNLLLGTAATVATRGAAAGTTLGKAIPVPDSVFSQALPADITKVLVGNGATNPSGAKTLVQVMQQIAQTGPVQLRPLAGMIGRMLPKENLMLTVDQKGLWNAHGAVSWKMGMPHLQLFTAGGREGLTYGTLLHEALHVVVLAKYKTLSTSLMRGNDSKLGVAEPKAAAQMEQFKNLWKEFQTLYSQDSRTMDKDLKLSLSEAAGNPDEFFVRTLTDPRFQKYLSEQAYKGKTLYERFKDWVKGIFFKEGTAPSWLDAALTATADLTDAMDKDASDYARMRAENTLSSKRSSERSKMEDSSLFSKMAPANAQSASPATVEATIQSLPVGLRPVARAVNAVLGGYVRRALNTINFTEDLLKRASALGITAADKYRQIANQRSSFVGAHERRVQAVTDMYDALPAALKGKGPGTANGFLYDSTQDEKWGYQPDYLTEKVDIDPAMKARFDAMPEGQAFIKAAFELGHYTLEEKKRIVIGHVASEYDALIAKAKTPEEKKELGDKKLEADKQYGSLMKIGGNKPYSPIKRYGNWVVLAKSAKYKAAVAAKDDALVKELEKDPAHYYVDFVENEAAADALERELKQDTNYSDVVYRQKEKARDELFRSSGTLGAINKLRMQLDAEQGAKTDEDGKVMRSKEAEAMHRMLTDLYLGALAEASSRKSEMRRRGISGNIDMVRALETQGKADANFLGAIMFDAATNEALNEMRRDVRTGDNRNEKSEIFNEILMRHVQSLNYRPAGIASKLTNLTSKWFLATSPAYYLQNATQPWMMSLPVMAGTHDYMRSAKALATAYGNVAQAFKDSGITGVVNFDKLLSKGNTALAQDEKDMLHALLDKGSIDIGMATELGQFRMEGSNQASEAWNKVDSKLRHMQTKLEALNRVTTALAAYRLQKEKPGSTITPAAYAEQIIDDTHGDYSAWNAPRAFNTELGRVALQFKKYQLIQLSLMAKMFTQAFGSASKPEKVMARKALAYMFGQAMLVGGGRALPIAAPVAYMFAAAFGEGGDEPPEYVFRRMVGNKDIADLLVGGVPTLFGADLSKFGGMGQMLSVVPFTDINLADRKGLAEVGFALLGGPLGGLTQRAAGGASDLANGNIVKGLEGFLPTGASNILKGFRVYTEGIVQKDGDITMSPDEVTLMDTAMQAMGVRPERQAARQFRQNAEFIIDGALKQQNAEIKRNYTQAIKSGDQMAISEARTEWREYQERRDRLGFDRSKESDLLQAPRKQAEREKKTVGNVQYRDKSERFVRQLETL